MKPQDLKLGVHAIARGYFEYDCTFANSSVVTKPILDAYNEAARMSALLSGLALTRPQYREKALWAEASAITLQSVLRLFVSDELPGDEFEVSPWRMEEYET